MSNEVTAHDSAGGGLSRAVETELPPIPATSPQLLFALAAGVLVGAYVLIARRSYCGR